MIQVAKEQIDAQGPLKSIFPLSKTNHKYIAQYCMQLLQLALELDSDEVGSHTHMLLLSLNFLIYIY